MYKILLVASLIIFQKTQADNEVLKLNLVEKQCENSHDENPYISLSKWIIDRMNELNFTDIFTLELSIHKVCTEIDYYETSFKIFKENRTNLGVIFTEKIPENIGQFLKVLKIKHYVLQENNVWHIENSIRTGVETLKYLKWNNLTLFYDNWIHAEFFFRLCRKEFICISSTYNIENYNKVIITPETNIILLSEPEKLSEILDNFHINNHLIVPLGFDLNLDYPDGSYIVQAQHEIINDTPLIFDVAKPILDLTGNVPKIINKCTRVSKKLDFFKKFYSDCNYKLKDHTAKDIKEFLSLEGNFAYNTYKIESSSNYTKILTYNIFENHDYNNNFSSFYDVCILNFDCWLKCVNFQSRSYMPYLKEIFIRSESWIFVILTLSCLGLIICLAIAIFFSIRFYKKDILEGNPTLTISLLFTTMLMYCAVIPFSLTSNDKNLQNFICLLRGLITTLTYALCFSVLLSRSILLATISKEITYMSHVPGPIQGFLTLFIFAVQGALSLQFSFNCHENFHGNSFLYLMSYNVVLLVILIAICPLNMKNHRNYKEGKYFTIAVFLIGLVFAIWMTGYVILENWKDFMLCLGLVLSASVLVSTIFIPRTYMMTVAVTRDKISSTIETSTSIVDVYRAGTQPLYDCINVAAINAVTIAKSALPPPPPPETDSFDYAEENFHEEFDRSDSSEGVPSQNSDKITRF